MDEIRSVSLTICLLACLVCPSVCLIFPSFHLPIGLSICSSVYPFVFLSVYLPIYLPVYLYVHLSVYLISLSVFAIESIGIWKLCCKMSCKFGNWHRQKRSCFVRHIWVQSWRRSTTALCDFLLPPVATKTWGQAITNLKTWRSIVPKCKPYQEISALTCQHLWRICLLYRACHTTRPLNVESGPNMRPHVLLATMVCSLSTSQPPRVARNLTF